MVKRVLLGILLPFIAISFSIPTSNSGQVVNFDRYDPNFSQDNRLALIVFYNSKYILFNIQDSEDEEDNIRV